MTLPMEQTSRKSLPPIFKLSALCNILPYFGYLHEWKNLLESISTGTNQVWNENWAALIHWGKDYKQETWLIYEYEEFIINKCIPQNLELFTLTTNWFDWVDSKKEENNWINTRLVTILLNKLNINNAIVIDQHIDSKLKSIIIWTEHEAEESTPSSLCTSVTSNITKFDEDKFPDLWKHIYEKVQSRRVILKKREDNIIEVNSVVPHSVSRSEDYNLLSSAYEKVKENFSCPVDNWICKPASLWWWPFKIIKQKNQFDHYLSLTEERWDEITRKIWDISTTKIIKQLKVLKMIEDFSSLGNLLKLKKAILNIEIVFDFKYEKTKYLSPSLNFQMNTKSVSFVFKGREWNFEQIINWKGSYIWYFSDVKPIDKSSYAVLKMNGFIWSNLVIKERSWADDWRKPYIEELKKNTKTNDDLFIIADLNNLEISIFHLSDIEYYSSIFKYFKHIIIFILPIYLENKKFIENINNLPNQYYYELRACYEKGAKYDSLNLIDSRNWEFIF